MNLGAAPSPRPTGRRGWSVALLAAVALSTASCDAGRDEASPDASADVDTPIELRDEVGPRVEAPDRNMAMTVDAVDVAGDDILVRLRVENHDAGYLDMGVQDTLYGPLLVMVDDRENRYESFAVEPAGVPGRRIADLSFRLAGPLDRDATSFELELATQRGRLTSPASPLPRHDGIRWRIDDPAASDPTFAAAPRLPDLIHFWLETDPLPADR